MPPPPCKTGARRRLARREVVDDLVDARRASRRRRRGRRGSPAGARRGVRAGWSRSRSRRCRRSRASGCGRARATRSAEPIAPCELPRAGTGRNSLTLTRPTRSPCARRRASTTSRSVRGHGVAGDEDDLRVFGVLGGERAVRPAAEDLLELVDAPRRAPPARASIASWISSRCRSVSCGQVMPPYVRGCPKSSRCGRSQRRQVAVDLLLLRQVDDHLRVRDDEAVLGDQRRQQHAGVLGDAERQQDRVHQVLVRLAVELQPGGVAQRQPVALVDPDVPRRAERAVRRDHARSAGGSSRRRRRSRSCTSRPLDELAVNARAPASDAADAHAHRAVLGLDRHDCALGELEGRAGTR